MVVPRSSTFIAADDEYSLFSVVVFKKVYEDFVNKCRENKCVAFTVANHDPSRNAIPVGTSCVTLSGQMRRSESNARSLSSLTRPRKNSG